ncbi:MAG: DUF3108 domain-containing protein, partial [Bdellovibrionota bacterium]
MLLKSGRIQSTAFFMLFVACWSGCAGGFLVKPDKAQPLPKELTDEMKEKFEIKDAPLTGAALVSTSVVSKKKKRKKGPAEPYVIPNRRPEVDPLQIGEKHVFNITYFGVSAGDFTMEVLPYKLIADRRVYHIRGTAISSNLFSVFYRLNDVVETFLDYEGLFSHRFHILLDESKQARDSVELFDSEKKQTFYWSRWNHKERGYSETKEFAPIQPFSQDSLSALLYLRTIPLPTGAVITFPVGAEGKAWEAVVTVLRRETVDSPNGPIQAVVLKPETRYQGILKKQGDSFLWLTDDSNRYVLRLEAKVKIGTVIAKLSSIQAG